MRNQNSKLKNPPRLPVGRQERERNGSTLILAILAMVILSALGVGMLATAYGVRHRAIRLKNEAAAMLAAEAGYEKAVYWMGQQKDMLSALQQEAAGTKGVLSFTDSSCDYQIKLFSFVGSRPIYRVISNGHSGLFNRTVEVYVVQMLSGWDMGMCRVPIGTNETLEVHFADDEIINMRVHINNFEDIPDYRDIYITGEPRFLAPVSMGESKYRDGGGDKPGYNDPRDYDDLMYLFEDGIYFDQPACRITDETTIEKKLERFKSSTKEQFKFEPEGTAPLVTTSYTTTLSATQLEFFVDDEGGKVRITDNCTILGYRRDKDSKTLDFKIEPDTDGEKYERYYIYSYHFMPTGGERLTVLLEQTYVTQSFGGVESEPGGQIYIDGNVIVGGDALLHNGGQVIKGKITVVATGNIWVGDSIVLDGGHDANGLPEADNPNILGLIAQGVVKVVDPGLSSNNTGYPNYYPGPPAEVSGYEYVPVGIQDEGSWVWQGTWPNKVWQEAEVYERHLADPVIVEAAMTVGGGGWGAENVGRYYYGYYGGRKEEGEATESWSQQDGLIVRGTITEAIRGVVGLVGKDGFIKQYYTDERVLEGILPGDIWMRGKYVATPAGWHDYRY